MNIKHNKNLKLVAYTSLFGIILSFIASFICFSLIFHNAFYVTNITLPRAIISWIIASLFGLIFIKSVKYVSLCMYIVAVIVYIAIGLCVDNLNSPSVRGWFILLYLLYALYSLPMIYIIKFYIIPKLHIDYNALTYKQQDSIPPIIKGDKSRIIEEFNKIPTIPPSITSTPKHENEESISKKP